MNCRYENVRTAMNQEMDTRRRALANTNANSSAVAASTTTTTLMVPSAIPGHQQHQLVFIQQQQPLHKPFYPYAQITEISADDATQEEVVVEEEEVSSADV